MGFILMSVFVVQASPAGDTAAIRHVYSEGGLQDLLQPSEVLRLKGPNPSAAARNHNSEAGKNIAF